MQRESTLPRLELLGGFRLVDGQNREIPVSGRKHRALLAVLALALGCNASRQGLASLLWSDRGDQQARNSLRQALAALKSDLASIEPSPLILQDDQVRLDLTRMSVDVVDFLKFSAHGALDTAAALFKGPLLAGLSLADNAFEEWARDQREAINEQAILVLDQLASRQAGEARIANAKRLVSLDPLREASHRSLMGAYAAAGEKGLALKQYEVCRTLLKQELGVAPAQQTEDQYSAILNGQGTADANASVPATTSGPTSTPISPETQPRRGAHSKPSIAVLPFANLSNDPSQQYLSDGISADITCELSRFHSLMVISGKPTFALQDPASAAVPAGAKLGVDYLLTGSVRTAPDRIRISVQLASVETGAVIWAQHFNIALADMFSVQDEVVSIIASTLTGQVQSDSAARVGSRYPSNVAAYDLALRGLQHQQLVTRKDTALAIDYLERAIVLDPTYAEAYAWLAVSHHTAWHFDFVAGTLENAIKIAAKGVELDPHSARCHMALGYCLLPGKQLERADHHFRRALTLNPNDAIVLTTLGMHETYRGRLDAAAQYFDAGLRFNPYPPDWFTEFRTFAAFVAGRFEEAKTGFEAARRLFPNMFWDALYLLATYGHLGCRDESARLVDCCRESHPNLSFLEIAANEPFYRPEDHARLIDGLNKALANLDTLDTP